MLLRFYSDSDYDMLAAADETVTSDGTNGAANELRLLTEMQPLCTAPVTTQKLLPTAKRAAKRKLEF